MSQRRRMSLDTSRRRVVGGGLGGNDEAPAVVARASDCFNSSYLDGCLHASIAFGRRLRCHGWAMQVCYKFALVSRSGLLAAAGIWPVNLKDSKKQVARPLHPGDDHSCTPS